MSEQVKSAAHEGAESAKELAGKLGTLVEAAVEVAEVKVREVADQVEVALQNAKGPKRPA
jgi:hypothetical protein